MGAWGAGLRGRTLRGKCPRAEEDGAGHVWGGGGGGGGHVGVVLDHGRPRSEHVGAGLRGSRWREGASVATWEAGRGG